MSGLKNDYEVEQKFPVADHAALRQRLVELGATLVPPIEQADTYFAHPARDFAKTDEALRLRTVGERNWITYKGPKIDTQTKTRRELEVPLVAGPVARREYEELLAHLGFRPVATVRKRREVAALAWMGYEVEAALDLVEHVGPFVELETSADLAGLAGAKDVLASLARQLGLEGGERRSYLELLLRGMS